MSGQVLADRYLLGDRLGTGGMSTVQLAVDRRLEREVAVKLLAEHLAEDEQFVSRFRREALAAARLVHPNIVQVFDFGLDEETGRHYIVMEYIRGQSAAEILRDRGKLAVAAALDIVVQSCRGLDYAHRNGVVHRDVKPGNLLRSDEGGVVKLADFGIAKALSDESSITQVGSVLGTAAYLAPEQAAGEEAGPQADIYALGVVTYQLLSGRLPYEAASLTELALKQQRETPPPLHHIADDVTPAARGRRRQGARPRPARPLAVGRRLPAGAGRRRARRRRRADRGHARGHAELRPDRRHERRAVARRAPRSSTSSAPRAPCAASRSRAAAPRRRRPRRPSPRRPRATSSAGAARGATRFFGTLLVLVLVGAGIAAAVVATSNSDEAVRLRARDLRQRRAGHRRDEGPRRGQHAVARLRPRERGGRR